MALDPQARALLDMMAALNAPELWTLTPEQARANMLAARQPTPKDPVKDVSDRTIPGPAGELPVRIYTPEGENLPAVVFYHGGGWVIGDIEYADIACRTIANNTPAVVISVDYRLAPEHKFPAPVDDCYAALEWTAANASSLGVDANRIAVGGDSAGGNLAAAVAIRARDENGPKIAHQLLVYPVTDHSFETPSYAENAEGYLLTKNAMVWFWDHYITGPDDSKNPLASPLQVADAKGLPPATILTAGFDPLRDEGKAYAEKLKAAGVPVTYRNWDGMIHGFFHLAIALDAGKEANAWAAEELKKAFSGVTA